MQGRIREADFIKGVAIFGVILIHVTAFNMRYSESMTDGGLFFAINQMGRFSVPIFFMLSGLFLFYRYYDNQTFPILAFFKKRTLYILIPYLSWSVFYLVYSWFAHRETAPQTVTDTITAVLTGSSYYHLYYIVVMVQFYLLLPLLIWTFRKFGGLTVVSFALLINVLANSMTWWEMSSQFPWMAPFTENAIRFFPVWLFYFCLGGWVGQRAGQILEWFGKIPFAAAIILFSSTGIWMLFNGFFRKETGFFNFSVLVYSIASLVLWFQMGGKWKHSWVSTLGRYSFGLYLIHPVLLNLFSRITPFLFPQASWMEFGFMLFAVTSLSLGLSVVIQRLPYSYLLTGK
ncbi:acyltransferase [Paenactinomyces guangxiensis]|uniref:Acyltransferase n=1 Tax=Paenactinomyces guangxiensis TaxID=1490290 RepID=A0A7W2AA02_9BACL|nr:acyltransferase [Paenactinomyces guangxiensis]MBA4495423.1 acyltransferase [Paenactinomyces guangxiensis]MBH8592456.1 acyltransferase [Paenactinomyces guangxiensis]